MAEAYQYCSLLLERMCLVPQENDQKLQLRGCCGGDSEERGLVGDSTTKPTVTISASVAARHVTTSNRPPNFKS